MTNNDNHEVKNTATSAIIENKEIYKESVRKLLHDMIGNALDEDTRETTQKLTEERQKAIQVLVEENKSAIKGMVEEGKKIIRARSQVVPTADSFHTDYIEEVISHIYKMMGTPGNGSATEMLSTETKPVPPSSTATAAPMPSAAPQAAPALVAPTPAARPTQLIEIEILPPRGQEEIEAINAYLNNIPQVSTVELITMVDKSIFRVKTSEDFDFVWRLRSLPQVQEAKSILEGGREKIQITLQAKSKLVKTQEEMNAKVKKIFRSKN